MIFKIGFFLNSELINIKCHYTPENTKSSKKRLSFFGWERQGQRQFWSRLIK